MQLICKIRRRPYRARARIADARHDRKWPGALSDVVESNVDLASRGEVLIGEADLRVSCTDDVDCDTCCNAILHQH